MKKGLISIGVLAGFILSLLMVSGAFAKDVITYEVPYGKVTFTHKKHIDNYKIDCLKCHHTWKKGETTGKMCKDCHKAKTEGKVLGTKEAFHNSCKGCHDDLKKANKPTGPAGCTQCHVKAKK
ncbi:MAG: cytochrome c3 family protein [Syntrophaceae bacterium]|nr:cytochrome c3 family protein [Syntrophaceae bacterium]